MKRLITYLLLSTAALTAFAGDTLPKGLMLNLDFSQVQDGLIPNKAFFPLYVPQCDAGIEILLQEQMLVLTLNRKRAAMARLDAPLHL